MMITTTVKESVPFWDTVPLAFEGREDDQLWNPWLIMRGVRWACKLPIGQL